jgi:hypothetical protein
VEASSSRGKEGLRTASEERNREGRVLKWGHSTGIEAQTTSQVEAQMFWPTILLLELERECEIKYLKED